MSTLLFFAFLAGFVTILAPCIWPLLPIVFSASAGGGKKRPLGITLGVLISFTVFTLSISYLVKIFPVDPNVLRLFAVVVIGLLGLCLVIPALGSAFESWVSRVLSPLSANAKREGTGFLPGLVTGLSLGLLWAPCAGPILATIATLAATQAVNLKVVAVTLAYVAGLGIPLFIFSFLSSTWFAKLRKVNKYTGRVQQVFGVIMIATALLIYTNQDKTLQVKILNLFPAYGKFLGNIENNPALQKELDQLAGRKSLTASGVSKSFKEGETLPDLGPAHELIDLQTWLNSPGPLKISDLKGQVVLVDFWTYSCVNCVRSLPHLTAWHEKYKDAGLVIIGVHTPEFAFEKEKKNVEGALKQFNIHYPVALDNDYGTWKSFENHYWPAEYLIDAKGHLRRTHFGEGEYDEMELAIRSLLKENGHAVEGAFTRLQDLTPKDERTPETYLGSGRGERFDSPERVTGEEQLFSSPAKPALHHFAYQGEWKVEEERATAGANAKLFLVFKASRVFLVIGPPEGASARLRVFVDGKPVAASDAGADVKQGAVTVDSQRLYELLDFHGITSAHVLKLEFDTPGTSVYAFTFG